MTWRWEDATNGRMSNSDGTLDRALHLVRFLRKNCPWDAKQTHASLVPYLLEESAEVADAVHSGDSAELEGELGDLLLNLAFQIVVAEEAGSMDAESVTARLEAKMRRRHPHLYGDGPNPGWEAIKAAERAEAGEEGSGVLSGIPGGLDALTRAYRIQARVATVGFDWADVRGALAKVEEELGEVREELGLAPEPVTEAAGASTPTPINLEAADPVALQEEIGDLLFAVVNAARLAGVHPTTALAAANRKFTRRFEGLEALANAGGIRMEEASLEELDDLWNQVKRTENG